MPSGIADSGRQLPTAAGASAPLRTWSPAFRPFGGQDVSLLAVDVVQQGDPGAAVRIVLDRVDHGRNAVLVAAEVDQPQLPLVAAAAMPGGDLALVVPPALALLRRQQTLDRRGAGGQFGEVAHGCPAAARRGRIVLANAHG